MAKTAILSVRIVADGKAAKKGLDSTAKDLEKFKSNVDKAAVPAAALTAGVGALAWKFGQMAAEAEQSAGAVDTVFKDAASTIHEFAKTAANDAGLSINAYEGLASKIGGSLSTAGYSMDELALKSDSMIKASADLVSVFGGQIPDAAAAMSAALRGEFDPLERYGIFLKKSDVNARLAAEGKAKLTGAALAAAEKQATYNLIMEQASKYTGNFAKEASTASGQAERAKAAFENAGAQLGQALLPALTAGASELVIFANHIKENETAYQALAIGIVAVAAPLAILSGAIKAYEIVAAVWAAGNYLVSASNVTVATTMRAIPIVALIAAVAAVIVWIVQLYQENETARAIIDRAWKAVVTVFMALVAAITGGVATILGWLSRLIDIVGNLGGPFRVFADGAIWAIDRVRSALQWLADKAASVRDALSSVTSAGRGVLGWAGFSSTITHAMAPPADGTPWMLTAASTAMPSLGWGSGRSAAVQQTTVHITVQGAIDPASTARQIRDLLNSDRYRTGRVLIGDSA